MEQLNAFMAIFGRVFGLLLLLPLDEQIYLPLRRLMLSFIISLAFIPYADPVQSLSLGNFCWQIAIGILISLPLSIFIDIIGTVGEFVDSGRGQTMAAQYTMAQNAPSGISSMILRRFVWVLLILSGILESLFVLLASSFETLPITMPVGGSFSEFTKRVFSILFFELNLLFWAFIPLLLIYLTVDLIMAAIQIVLPNLPLHAESFVLKNILTAIIILIGFRSNLDFAYYDVLLNLLKINGNSLGSIFGV